MLRKSEIIKTGLLTALVAFATIAVLAAIMAPDSGITTQVYALNKINPGKGGFGSPFGGTGAGIECDCLGIA